MNTISLDKKYTTLSGLKVVIYAIYPELHEDQVHGAIFFDDGDILTNTWDIDGEYCNNKDAQTYVMSLKEVEENVNSFKACQKDIEENNLSLNTGSGIYFKDSTGRTMIVGNSIVKAVLEKYTGTYLEEMSQWTNRNKDS